MPTRVATRCRVAGCERKHRCRGYCKLHYSRLAAGKVIAAGVRQPSGQRGTVCTAPSCARPAYARQLCKAHYARSRSGKPLEAPLRESATRPCRDCGVPHNGYSDRCKWCGTKAWRAAHPDYRKRPEAKAKDFWYRRTLAHGITREQWESMFARQGAACAACGDALTPETANTDHCHATGVVRGILCRLCNVAAGFLEDSPARARKILAYLERHRQLRIGAE